MSFFGFGEKTLKVKENASNIVVNLDSEDQQFMASPTGIKDCRIDISCDEMKKLVVKFKSWLALTDQDYSTKVTALSQSLAITTENLNTSVKLAEHFAKVEAAKVELSTVVKKRDALREKGHFLEPQIKCSAYFKNKNEKIDTAAVTKIKVYKTYGDKAKTAIGLKKSPYRTVVDVVVSITEKGKTKIETLKDLDLSELCLDGREPCDINGEGSEIPATATATGGAKKTSKMRGGNTVNSESEDIMNICE